MASPHHVRWDQRAQASAGPPFLSRRWAGGCGGSLVPPYGKLKSLQSLRNRRQKLLGGKAQMHRLRQQAIDKAGEPVLANPLGQISFRVSDKYAQALPC